MKEWSEMETHLIPVPYAFLMALKSKVDNVLRNLSPRQLRKLAGLVI